ncbi:hypothetical protein M5689_003328 [Euphorbia peplus]|nr:hypothetical protein M5689_003328 [Euphorbia peplus]
MREELEQMKEQLSGVQELKEQMALLMKLVEKELNTKSSEPPGVEKSKENEGENSGGKNRPYKNKEDVEIPEYEESKFDEDRFDMLEERLRSMEGSYDVVDAKALCLVPDVVMPHKFRTPDFEKFSGLSCPKDHLTMYCRKMGSYASDDKILIQVFQESLQGAPLRWYMQLERAHVRKWNDLADAFMGQYRHNMDLAPTREDLRNTQKGKDQTFREYAMSWRDKAAEIKPPMSEKDMINIFLETLQQPYYGALIAHSTVKFSDFVTAGERIDVALRNGRLDTTLQDKSGIKKVTNGFKRKEETHMVEISPETQGP